MKRKILFAMLIGLQSLWMAPQVFAMNDIDCSSSKREQRLSGFLSQIFGVDVQINGDTVNLKGTQEQLEGGIAKLNDFNELRKQMIPVSSKAIVTQVCPNSKFSSWNECLISLGIPQFILSNFESDNLLDQDGCVRIPHGLEKPKDGNITFNHLLAILYVEEIQKQSSYFNLKSRSNAQLIQKNNDYHIINYGLLAEYLCSLPIKIKTTDTEGVFVSDLSLQSILERLEVAVGGPNSLGETSTPGQYSVYTIVSGIHSHQKVKGLLPTIEIIIDKSTSMRGNRIDEINKRIPMFLQELRNTLTKGQSLKVEVHAFSNDISKHKDYTFNYLEDYSKSPIEWKPIEIGHCGTDLTKVGNRLKLSSSDEHKFVVAFTDGEHTSTTSDLNTNLKSLVEMKHFGEPYFCLVGTKDNTNSSDYFSKLSKAFAGSFFHHDTIEEFCENVCSKVYYLLESNSPFKVTKNGVDFLARQQDAKPDIHTATQTVSIGDSITYQGIKKTVELPTTSQPTETSSVTTNPQGETKEEKIRRLKAEIAELESI